ncbi:hypothetical protein E3E12_07605 [Formicincola oecophyllae]|uniref:Uncharacterized protein n=1 Tax=Formicincola oecophyllae TaxID=2558361 RepID=A0A4Y6U9C1_9PROT|nr:hypothetical protein [Formicincola oecophyllae]QDH14063.1 hypothetical protein E3E12_07605 [Formicincola oecophyllae]
MVDRYTKVVLTLIAGALIVLAGENLLLPDKAEALSKSNSPAHVIVDSIEYISSDAMPVKVQVVKH